MATRTTRTAKPATTTTPPQDAAPDLVFTTPTVQSTAAPEPPVTIDFDGQRLTATRPTDGVLMSLAPATSRRATGADQIEACLRFLDRTLDEPSAAYMTGRIEAATGDDLAALLEQIGAMISALLDRWMPNAAPVRARDRTRR